MNKLDMIIKGCENWLKNHGKNDYLPLAYEAVQDLVSVLKEHNVKTAGDNKIPLKW